MARAWCSFGLASHAEPRLSSHTHDVQAADAGARPCVRSAATQPASYVCRTRRRVERPDLPRNPEQTGLGKRSPMRDIDFRSKCSWLAAVPSVRSHSTGNAGRCQSACCSGGCLCVAPAALRFECGGFRSKGPCGLWPLRIRAAFRVATPVSAIWRHATASITCPGIPSV